MNQVIDSGTPATLLGALIVAIAALAGAIGYLFRFYGKRAEQMESERVAWAAERAAERGAWATEREQLRADYEERYRIAVEKHVLALQALYEASRDHEAVARREYTANMEAVAQKAAEATEKLAAFLSKFYDRYVRK